MKIINIIGAGRVGQTLAYLWHQQAQFRIQALCCRTMAHAQAAVDFVGAGVAYDLSAPLPCADIWLLACPDDELASCCTGLAQAGAFGKSIVLHCSGALTAAEVLYRARDAGAWIASVHPIKSFAQARLAVADFAGTFCGVEGDTDALAVLLPAFGAIGAQCLSIKPQAKTLYHAASVVACNYLVALQELSIQTYAQAGISREQALAILQPMVQGTVDNIFKVGTREALTGPIARGDVSVVAKQLQAMTQWRDDYGALYRQLAQLTAQLVPDTVQRMAID